MTGGGPVTDVVRYANAFARSIGCGDEPPVLQASTIGKMGLKGVAGLRVLKAYYEMGRPDGVMKEAAAVIDRTRGTVEELIALSLVYHAHRQSNRKELALTTRATMLEVFEQLKRKPGAFPASSGGGEGSTKQSGFLR